MRPAIVFLNTIRPGMRWGLEMERDISIRYEYPHANRLWSHLSVREHDLLWILAALDGGSQ